MGAQSEVGNIQSQLNSISNELLDIANGIATDFKGIENDRCSKSITEIAYAYKREKDRLGSINYQNVLKPDEEKIKK